MDDHSPAIHAFAAKNRFRFEANPALEWFETWEPFDTMVAANRYQNAVIIPVGRGIATVVEPWYASEGSEPLERAWLVFFSHPACVRRAAARVEEHFNTRVAWLDRPPMPEVKLGDSAWDARTQTRAASAAEAAAAFNPQLRALLLEWRFRGHFEIRPGGALIHFAGAQPNAAELERMLAALPRIEKRLG